MYSSSIVLISMEALRLGLLCPGRGSSERAGRGPFHRPCRDNSRGRALATVIAEKTCAERDIRDLLLRFFCPGRLETKLSRGVFMVRSWNSYGRTFQW